MVCKLNFLHPRKLTWQVTKRYQNCKFQSKIMLFSHSHAWFLEGNLKFIFKKCFIIKWGGDNTTIPRTFQNMNANWIHQCGNKRQRVASEKSEWVVALSSNWKSTTLPRSSKYPYVENKLPLISNTFTLQTRHCCPKNDTQCRPGKGLRIKNTFQIPDVWWNACSIWQVTEKAVGIGHAVV